MPGNIEPVEITIQVNTVGADTSQEEVDRVMSKLDELQVKQASIERQMEMASIRQQMIYLRMTNMAVSSANAAYHATAALTDMDKETRKHIETVFAFISLMQVVLNIYQEVLWARRAHYHALREEQLAQEQLIVGRNIEIAQTGSVISSKAGETSARVANTGASMAENSMITFGTWLPIGMTILATIIGLIGTFAVALKQFHEGGEATKEGLAILKRGEIVLPAEVAEKRPLPLTTPATTNYPGSYIHNNNININIQAGGINNPQELARIIANEVRDSIIRIGGNPYEQ